MQLALRADSTECGYESGGSPSRRTKLLVAGVAMASAGVLVVNPVMPSPAVSDIREMAVELSALANPLTEWQQTIANTFTSLNRLSTDVAAAQATLAQALSNPAVHAELTDMIIGNLTNPLPLLTALANFPSNFGPTILAGLEDMSAAQQEAFATLPTVLLNSANHLAQGQFLEAFSEINVWFLVNLLSDSRQGALGLFAIPGDFADSIGAAPLARVFDALINRGMVGNLGRALLAAQVTSTIQLAQILDSTRAALQAGDFETALSELINMPAKVTNAFLNGYDPGFETDPQFPPQTFPGLLHQQGFLSYFAVTVPKAIAGALAPAPATTPLAAAPTTLLSSPTDVPESNNAVTLTVDTGDDTSLVGDTGAKEDTTETTSGGNDDGVPDGPTDEDTSGDDDTDDTTGDDGATGDDDSADDTTPSDEDTTGDGDTTGSTTNGASDDKDSDGGESGGGESGSE